MFTTPLILLPEVGFVQHRDGWMNVFEVLHDKLINHIMVWQIERAS